MPTNRHAIIRYQALDKCFRNKFRRYYIDDLIAACNDALYEYVGPQHEVARRQVFEDIKFMESEQGWSVPLERIKDGRRVYYRYSIDFSINNAPLNDEEINALSQTILTLSRFRGMPQFEWIESLLTNLEDKFHLQGNREYVIGFEQNIDYLAAKYLYPLFNAIINQQVVHIHYRTFKGIDHEWDIHPYFIKQYNNRWFLLGKNDQHREGLVTIPLDRIVALDTCQLPYIENKDIDFEEYFDDIIGVTIQPKSKLERIVLRFTPERFPYIETKPLHGSMKVKDRQNCIVELNLIPNPELESLLFSFGDQVEVLEPQYLRERIKEKIEQLCKKYFCCADRLHTSF